MRSYVTSYYEWFDIWVAYLSFIPTNIVSSHYMYGWNGAIIHLLWTDNIMRAGDLATRGSETSSSMVLTQFLHNKNVCSNRKLSWRLRAMISLRYVEQHSLIEERMNMSVRRLGYCGVIWIGDSPRSYNELHFDLSRGPFLNCIYLHHFIFTTETFNRDQKNIEIW